MNMHFKPEKPPLTGLLIDPVAKTVEEIDLPANVNDTFRGIYPIIGCTMVEVVTLHNGLLLIDEEGLLKPNHHFVIMDNENERIAGPFAGKCILVGRAKNGDITGHDIEALDLAWLGDDKGLERAIQKGAVPRPQSSFCLMLPDSFDPDESKRETLWEWGPHTE